MESFSVLVGWAPGDLGLVCPPDTALRLPKGCRLRIEMHYTPNGKETKDRSSVGLIFAKKPPKYEMFMSEFANLNIEVPPHDASSQGGGDHAPAGRRPHPESGAAHALARQGLPLRGPDPDGKRKTILSVPRWDFNWQNVYRFEEPVKLPKGARLHAVAHWDNSRNNLLNPGPREEGPVRPADLG